jgi:hypothetical protein
MVASSLMDSAKIEELWGPPWPAARAALARATGHHKLNREHLHVLGNERDPFCPLATAETGHGMRLTGSGSVGS